MMEIPEAMLGYKNGAKWLDMSRYVVHFTHSQVDFVNMLREGRICPRGPFGWGRNVQEVKIGHMSACFSEIPLNHIGRLIKRHGNYGLIFKKEFILDRGGGRVWYLDSDSPFHGALFTLVGTTMRAKDFKSPLWKLTPLIDQVNPAHGYAFEWEREWRVPGGLSFTYSDVQLWVGGEYEVVIDSLGTQAIPAWTPTGEAIGSIESSFSGLSALAARRLEEFFEYFTDPINELYYDEGGGFVWFSAPVETEEAVDEVFPHLEVEHRASLVSVLDDACKEWLRISDLEH